MFDTIHLEIHSSDLLCWYKNQPINLSLIIQHPYVVRGLDPTETCNHRVTSRGTIDLVRKLSGRVVIICLAKITGTLESRRIYTMLSLSFSLAAAILFISSRIGVYKSNKCEITKFFIGRVLFVYYIIEFHVRFTNHWNYYIIKLVPSKVFNQCLTPFD